MAASSPRPSVANAGQGRATRSRSDLHLRDRVKVDTPDVSTHGDGEDINLREEDNLNGNAHCVDRLEGGDEEGDENDSKDEGEEEEEEETDEEAGENADNEDIDDEESDNGDEVNENPIDADMDRGESGDDDDDDEINEESTEDCEEEGCRCTSNWSCGGHLGQKRPDSCSSTPKLQVTYYLWGKVLRYKNVYVELCIFELLNAEVVYFEIV